MRADATECWSCCSFAPSTSCSHAEDDESTSSAVEELGVCTLLSASGFTQCSSCGSSVLPGPAPWLPVPGGRGDYGSINCPPNWKAVCDHVDAAIVLSVDVVRVVL